MLRIAERYKLLFVGTKLAAVAAERPEACGYPTCPALTGCVRSPS
jgi:hypothetical protein